MILLRMFNSLPATRVLFRSVVPLSTSTWIEHASQMIEQDEESGPFRHLNSAAFMTHSAIHTARPDVLCAAHTHSVYGKTFSSLGVPLSILNQDACAFYNVSEIESPRTAR